jgi:hypothetical protein
MISLWFSAQILPLYIKTAHLTNHGSHACRGRIILQGISGPVKAKQAKVAINIPCYASNALQNQAHNEMVLTIASKTAMPVSKPYGEISQFDRVHTPSKNLILYKQASSEKDNFALMSI